MVLFVISVKHEVGITSGINITSDSQVLLRYRVLSSMEGVKLNVIKIRPAQNENVVACS